MSKASDYVGKQRKWEFVASDGHTAKVTRVGHSRGRPKDLPPDLTFSFVIPDGDNAEQAIVSYAEKHGWDKVYSLVSQQLSITANSGKRSTIEDRLAMFFEAHPEHEHRETFDLYRQIENDDIRRGAINGIKRAVLDELERWEEIG